MANLHGQKWWEEIISEFEAQLFGRGKAQHSISTYVTAIRNKFSRDIFNIGFGGLLREKSPESQEEIFWYLTEGSKHNCQMERAGHEAGGCNNRKGRAQDLG